MNTPLNTYIAYRDQQLHIELLSVRQIAEQIETPFYCYSKAMLHDNMQTCRDAFGRYGIDVHYAVKANSNLTLLSLIAAQGLGVDLVSAGELKRVVRAGVPGDRMVFSGVGKTQAELRYALLQGVGRINVESAEELAALAGIAAEMRICAKVTLRVNPDVAANTHAHITTGTKGNKFGIESDHAVQLVAQYAEDPYLSIDGLAMHIGSQICEIEPYRLAASRLVGLAQQLVGDGYSMNHLDLGGGFGVDYGDGQALALDHVAKTIAEVTSSFNGTISVEPGRFLGANIGVLVSRIVYVKEADPLPFVILDAGMNDLMRPALYQARHQLVPVEQRAEASGERLYDVVGPVCESTDTFSRGEPLTTSLAQGELVAFLSAGAYCAVMSNSYNSRTIPAELLVDGDEVSVVRRAVTQDLLLYFEENI
ncbi:diaminopimelate decarboxylase [Pontibacterium granulatum]|uniref:diaminopimelate decarboxylase n=1 Tax=Pontibacterium granulatum TaxID=2036029 RepID=UPI00249C2D6D|nr:diaminopimelate decarboxylase [Pontibacterium granulatum]MDI3324189.1 diaminopimelate decarboxylase [Pontibacterium granulatum]